MFQELMPLLAQRVIMVTATRINTDLSASTSFRND